MNIRLGKLQWIVREFQKDIAPSPILKASEILTRRTLWSKKTLDLAKRCQIILTHIDALERREIEKWRDDYAL